jgi:hypothetical protein
MLSRVTRQTSIYAMPYEHRAASTDEPRRVLPTPHGQRSA